MLSRANNSIVRLVLSFTDFSGTGMSLEILLLSFLPLVFSRRIIFVIILIFGTTGNDLYYFDCKGGLFCLFFFHYLHLIVAKKVFINISKSND